MSRIPVPGICPDPVHSRDEGKILDRTGLQEGIPGPDPLLRPAGHIEDEIVIGSLRSHPVPGIDRKPEIITDLQEDPEILVRNDHPLLSGRKAKMLPGIGEEMVLVIMDLFPVRKYEIEAVPMGASGSKRDAAGDGAAPQGRRFPHPSQAFRLPFARTLFGKAFGRCDETGREHLGKDDQVGFPDFFQLLIQAGKASGGISPDRIGLDKSDSHGLGFQDSGVNIKKVPDGFQLKCLNLWKAPVPVKVYVPMKRILCALGVLLLAACSKPAGVTTVERFPEGINAYYPSVSAPVQPQQLVKLPYGSIRPEGWIRRQLELQKDGLCGHLGEISAWLQKEDNAWLSSGGQWGWEEVPYWLRGYAATGMMLNDPAMLEESRIWIEAILSSQREDGYFGPAPNKHPRLMPGKKDGCPDYWPNMVAIWILQDYYEFTSDERVLPFMLRYFRYLDSLKDDELYTTYWENSRAGDNLWSVAWLYARRPEPWLLAFADKIHRCMADWTSPSSLPNWHNVNIAECFREPATYYLFKRDSALLRATYRDYDLVRRAYGQVPGGMFGADENARNGYIDPRQGTETCGFAEQMASDEILLLITGDPLWAENCEDVTFNSFPAAFMPDNRSLRYITSPNMTVSDSENHSPSIQNRGPYLSMNPFSSRCCQHNHGFGWPYYAAHLVFATPDNGAAVLLYNACEARVKVGDGTEVTLKEETHYPFEETVRFTVSTPSEVLFPLYLRIPSWCGKAGVRVDGKQVSVPGGQYARIERKWKEGDTVELELPMEISFREWAVNQHSVSVDYGPLTLSLEIGEEYIRMDSRETATGSSRWQEGADASAWPSWTIKATTPWNYALDMSVPVRFKERRPWPADDNPFTLESVPLRFTATAARVPSWGLDDTGFTEVLPEESAPRSPESETVTLVPMGAARLRISAFPQR